MNVNIGILAFQGDFQKHADTFSRLGAETTMVRTVDALDRVSALVIPGGESTTIGKLLDRFELLDPIRRRIASGTPVMGTCAGTILLADRIEESDQVKIGGLDIAVKRNAYGRQIDSFSASVTIPELGEPAVETVFIRAPVITATGPGVTVLAEYNADPVLVRQENILTLTFHPELTPDDRIHRYFLDRMCNR